MNRFSFASLSRLVALGFVAAIASLPLSARAVVHYPPVITTDMEKIQWLLHIQDQIPWLFRDAADYDSNLMSLIDKERDLIAELKKVKAYKNEAKAKPGLKKVEIEVMGTAQVPVRKLKPEVLKAWRQAVKAVLQELGSSSGIEARLVSKIREKLTALSQQDPKGMLIGLINSIPEQAERPPIFQLSAREQVAALRANVSLTNAVLAENFRAQNFGLAGADLSKQALLARVEKLLADEEELQTLLLARKLIAAAPAEARGDTAKLLDFAGTISAQKLDAFDGSIEGNPAFTTKVIDEAVDDKAQTKRAAAYLQRTFQAWVKASHGTFSRKKKIVAETVTLVEVPPYLALYRGFIGGDCSTSYSYGFPYNPLEKVFFIYDSRGQLKGYIGGIVVEVPNGKTFYVRDVTGSSLSARMAEIALVGLNTVVQKFGAGSLAIASENRTDNNNHFETIKHMLSQYRNRGTEVNFTYPANDEEIRTAIIWQGSDETYDSYDDNDTGTIFEPRPELLAATRAKVAGVQPPAYEPKPITRAQGVKLAGLLMGSNRTSIANQVLEVAGVTQEEWKQFAGRLTNPNALPLTAYYSDVARAFRELTGEEDPTLTRSLAALLRVGHGNAPDMLTTRDQEQLRISIEIVKTQLKGHYVNDLLQKLAQHKEVFNESASFQDFLSTLIDKEDWSQAQKLVKLDGIGIHYKGLADRIPELVEMLEEWDEEAQQAAMGLLQLLPSIDKEIADQVAEHVTDTDETGKEAMLTLLRHGIRVDANKLAEIVELVKDEEGYYDDDYRQMAAVFAAVHGKRSNVIRELVNDFLASNFGQPDDARWQKLQEQIRPLAQKMNEQAEARANRGKTPATEPAPGASGGPETCEKLLAAS